MAGKDLGTIYYKVESDTSKVIDSVTPVKKGVEAVKKELDNLDKSFDQAEKGSKKAGKAIKEVGDASATTQNQVKPLPKAIREIGTASSASSTALKQFTGLFAGLLTINAAGNLLAMADRYGEMAERIKMATSSQEEYERVQARLLDTANRTYRSLSEAQEMYIRTADGLRSMGYNTEQAVDITDSLSYSFVKNATSQDRAAAATSAYAKAINKGKVEADAWETIIAAIPTVIEDIAKASGQSTQAVRELGATGKITATQLNEGLRQALTSNQAAADGMATTLNDAFTAFGNNLGKFMGEANSSIGVTNALSSAIIALSENLNTIVTLVGIVGGAYLAKYIAGLALAAVNSLKFAANSAKVAIGLAAETRSMGGAAAAAAAYTTAMTGAGVASTRMGAQAVTAVGNITKIGTGLATAARGVGAVVGLLAGPVGMIISLGIAAASFLDFGSGADAAGESLLRMGQPLDQTIAKIKELNETQVAAQISLLEGDQQKQQTEAIAAWNGFVDQLTILGQKGARGVAQMRASIKAELLNMVTDSTLSVDQLSAAISTYLDRLVIQGVITKDAAAGYLAMANSAVEAQGRMNETAAALGAANERATQLKEGVAGAASEVANFPELKGMDKWDEYLQKLLDARDAIGMNSRELGEMRARQEGANAAQQQMSGIISAQIDEFGNLKTAIEKKDTAAADAAKTNIRNLDIERQKVALLAEQTATLMAVTANFAKNGISGDVQAGVLTNLNKWFEKRFNSVTPSAGVEDAISRTVKNTVPGSGLRTKKGGAGAGGGKSETVRAAEENAKAIASMRTELDLLGKKGEELEQTKALNKLNKYATPEDVETVKQLANEIYKLEEYKKLNEKIGEDAQAYIRGNDAPLSGGEFDEQAARYKAEEEVEKQRYADQLVRLREVMEAKRGIWDEYYTTFEAMNQNHQDRMAQIEQAKNKVMLTDAAEGFGQMSADFSAFATEFGAENAKMFKLAKATAIAQAIIETYLSAQKAFSAMAGIPIVGPALGAVAAGVAVAGGLARVSAIRSTSAPGRQYGGPVNAGGMYRVNENGAPEMLQASNGQQFLLPNSRGQVVSNNDATGNGQVNAPGVVVKIIENPNKAGTQEESTDEFGRRVATVFIADFKGGGPMSRTTAATFGMNRKGT